MWETLDVNNNDDDECNSQFHYIYQEIFYLSFQKKNQKSVRACHTFVASDAGLLLVYLGYGKNVAIYVAMNFFLYQLKVQQV